MNARSRILKAAAVASLLAMAACATVFGLHKDDERLQPSKGTVGFNADDYSNFADYLARTRSHLIANKVTARDISAAHAFKAAMPFELPPAGHCRSGSPQRGILLIHGLSDTPFAMRDLGMALARQCFLVRAILLPGHGTRPGDLLDIEYADWTAAVEFGLQSLRRDTDQVYAGGFSLGGLLAIHAGLTQPDIAGVIAISPALTIGQEILVKQSVWIRHLTDWIEVDPTLDYARYESMPFNAAAETYLLARETRRLLGTEKLHIPLFLAQSSDDPVIDPRSNRQVFRQHVLAPASLLLEYRRTPENAQSIRDPRIRYINSHLPAQKISGFSHRAIHTSPANGHYGKDGDFRSCGADADRSAEDVAGCEASHTPWRGEMFGDYLETVANGEPMERLSFNPLFEGLLAEMAGFLNSKSD